MTDHQILVVGFTASALTLTIGCVRAVSTGHVAFAAAMAAAAILLLVLAWGSER